MTNQSEMDGEIDDSQKMHIKVFTDKNLASYLSQGWDYDGLISGKIKTLHGKIFIIECTKTTTIAKFKCLIEDQEGYDRKDQIIMKWKKKLEDVKTLSDYWIDERTTLLLQMPIEFDVLKDDPRRSKDGLKSKQRGTGSKTIQRIIYHLVHKLP
jgi:hypothetical protein